MADIVAWCIVSVVAVLSSCDGRSGMLPPSGGKLCEVLLVGDSADIVANALQADVPGLPQSEPQFDVSSIDSAAFGATLRATRNIVVIRTSPAVYSSVRIRYDRNVWAEPQLVVTVTAPSMRIVADSIGSLAPTIARLLNASENRKAMAMLRNHRDVKAERIVDSMFHVRMWIPIEMVASRKGRDFLWLSNNSPSLMTNIVVYKARRGGDPLAERDSALGKNIKGETDRMHMATVRPSVAMNTDGTVFRGLWEMTGDDMGGPFICRRVKPADGELAHEVAVEVFVFAPGKGKRNAMRQLEAVLRSIDMKQLTNHKNSKRTLKTQTKYGQ